MLIGRAFHRGTLHLGALPRRRAVQRCGGLHRHRAQHRRLVPQGLQRGDQEGPPSHRGEAVRAVPVRGLALHALEGERAGEGDRREAGAADLRPVDAADEEVAPWTEDLADQGHDPPLGDAVEVDQQVAAKDDVVAPQLTRQLGRHDVALDQRGLLHHLAVERVLAVALLEEAAPKGQVAAEEGGRAVARRGGVLQRACADVHRVDGEGRRRGELGERHHDGVGLLTTGAAEAQRPDRRPGLACGWDPLRDALPQQIERSRLTEEPAVADDDLLDQRQDLPLRPPQPAHVRLMLRCAGGLDPALDRAIEGLAADGLRHQADLLGQDRLDLGVGHQPSSSVFDAAASTPSPSSQFLGKRRSRSAASMTWATSMTWTD